MGEPKHCCLDFEPVDPEDSLCCECVCGHVTEEHQGGFFRTCIFTPEEPEKPVHKKGRKGRKRRAD